MNLFGRAAQVCVPEPVRKLLLTRLFEGTAAAFGRPVPPLQGKSAAQTLEAFREFTARLTINEAASPAVSQRLFDVTCRYGKWVRRAFGVGSMDDAMAAARVLYGILGIDFSGDARGEITVSRCFFSCAYTPEVCKLMSALDAGMLAGLSDGGKLVFAQRMTEGYPCCRARLGRVEAIA